MAHVSVVSFALVLLFITPAEASLKQTIASILQPIAEQKAAHYNCSIAIGFVAGDGTVVSVAAGVTDRETGRTAKTTDKFVWGSVTKTFTGPAVLQLINDKAMTLDDPITTRINPWLQRVNGSRLEDIFGEGVRNVTLKHLLHMTSGLPDYDTSWLPGDPWRQRQYDHPLHDFGPLEIIWSLNKSVPGTFPAGTAQYYSSTNYILLGMVLAQHYNATNWDTFDQSTVIPVSLKASMPGIEFAVHGPCSKYTEVHGYDMYMVQGFDVWNVSCLGGWTAGNVVGTVEDMARWTQSLYGPPGRVVPPYEQAEMRDTSLQCNQSEPHCAMIVPHGYGLATFNLSRATGRSGPLGESWGHLGSTYGYQSMTNYFPALNFTLTVASNIEISDQDQPSDALCFAYNSIANLMLGLPLPQCQFRRSGYFFGYCECS